MGRRKKEAASADQIETHELHSSELRSQAHVVSSQEFTPTEIQWVDAPSSLSITFTGDPRGGPNPEIADWHGTKFPLDEPVVIEDAGWIKRHGAKLKRHNHFSVE